MDLHQQRYDSGYVDQSSKAASRAKVSPFAHCLLDGSAPKPLIYQRFTLWLWGKLRFTPVWQEQKIEKFPAPEAEKIGIKISGAGNLAIIVPLAGSDPDRANPENGHG